MFLGNVITILVMKYRDGLQKGINIPSSSSFNDIVYIA